MKPRAYYEAIATMTGCIIGAGIFGIPYVFVRAGFWTGLLVLAVVGSAAIVLHLLVGEVTLGTRKCHQLVGYSEKYLGKTGKYLMTLSMIIGVYGAMIAYTLGVSESLSAAFGGPQVVWAILFYVIMSVLLFGGLQMLERSEILMEGVKFLIFALVLWLLFSSIHFSPARFTGFAWDKLLLPYGVLLFAFLGTAAIPEVWEEMRKCRLLTKRVIIIGSLLPIIVSGLFAIAVVGVTGGATTEVATIGLADLIGGFGFALLHLFAILAMTTSFIALGYAMKQTYRLDYGIPQAEAWALTMVIPAVLIMIGVSSFVNTLEIAGTFAGGIAGITIVLMHLKAKKRFERKPEYKVKINRFGYGALIILFLIGMVYQLSLIL